MNRLGHSHATAIFLIVLVFAISLLVRWENVFERQLISHNEDATGHVLTTMRSMDAAPASVHKFLPIATISQGVGDRRSENFHRTSIEDDLGNYYYVSFPPLGFAAPYMLISGVGLPMDLVNLRLFSAALGLISTLLLYLLLARILAGSWLSQSQQRLVALLLALLFLLNSESLWVFGNVYWHHVLFQPALVLALLVIWRTLHKPSTGNYLGLGVVLFLACLIEWSGFLLAGSVTLLGLWLLWKKREGLGLAVTGAASGAAALITIIWHFSLAAGIFPYLKVLATRPGDHITRPGLLVDLLLVFLPLYLPLLVLAAVLWFAKSKAARATEPHSMFPVWAVLFCAAGASGQSALLLHHSIWYTYGTLTVTTLLLLCMAAMFHLGRGHVGRLVWISAASVVFWGILYFVQNPTWLKDSAFGRQFREYEVVRAFPGNDYVAFTNVGGDNSQMEPIYAGRNLIETPTFPVQPTLQELQDYLRGRPEVQSGKLFLFDEPGRFSGSVWWPYSKTRPL